MFPEIIDIDDVLEGNRTQRDYGNIDELAASIKEYGGKDICPIQPIVLGDDFGLNTGPRPLLIAGGRRLAALRKLGVKQLRHGKHWVHRDEDNATAEGRLRLKGMELEENLKRKEMSWDEVILGKQQLMEIMTKIHGNAVIGGRTRSERANPQEAQTGFGVRKLAAMLNESPAQTSRDLQIARAVTLAPQLRQQPSKEGAFKTMQSVIVKALVAKGIVKQAPVPAQAPAPMQYKIIITCDTEAHQTELLERLLGEGLKCQALIV